MAASAFIVDNYFLSVYMYTVLDLQLNLHACWLPYMIIHVPAVVTGVMHADRLNFMLCTMS